MTLVMLLGLFLLAVGAIDLARAIARSETLPRWGGRALAAGLALWVPLLPRPIRVVDGLAIGLGGAWLAWAIWRQSATGAATAERPPRPSSSESMLTARCTP
jgi:hypothetical protein